MSELLLLDVPAEKKQPKAKRLNLKAAIRSQEIEDAWKAAWNCAGLPEWAKDAYKEVWEEAHAEICWLRTKKQRTQYEEAKGLTGGTVSKYVGPKLNRVLAYIKANSPEDAPISQTVKDMRLWCGSKIIRKNVDYDTSEWCPLEYVEVTEVIDDVADLTDTEKTGVQDRAVLVPGANPLKAFSPKKTKRIEISWKSMQPVKIERTAMLDSDGKASGSTMVNGFSIILIKDKLMAHWAGLKGLELLLGDPTLEQIFFSQYLSWDAFDENEFWPRRGCRKWLDDTADRKLTEILLAKMRAKVAAELPNTINVFLGGRPELDDKGFQRWTGKIANQGVVKDVVFTKKSQPKESPLSLRTLLEPKSGLGFHEASANLTLPIYQSGASVADVQPGLPDSGPGKDGPGLDGVVSSPDKGQD
jgi:hypothetical protein